MRVRPWMAAVVLAGILLAASVGWMIRSYLEIRAFADRIYEPLPGDAFPAGRGEEALELAAASGGIRAGRAAADGTGGRQLAEGHAAGAATSGGEAAYFGTIASEAADCRPDGGAADGAGVEMANGPGVGTAFGTGGRVADGPGGGTADKASAEYTLSNSPAAPACPEGRRASQLERIGNLEEARPFAVLFIGVDRRTGDRGRADALVTVALNPGKRSSLVVSIPRDTRAKLAGLDRPVTDKINHAYAFGGIKSTVATVEQFLGVPISRYVQADMEGFRAMVDILGGVRVDNERAFAYEGFYFQEGTLELDGEAALAYVRMRKDDPRGDLGRADRQKAVLTGIAKAAIQPGRIDKWPDLIAELSNYMKTDLTFADWKALVKHYLKAADTVETEQIKGSGLMLNGIYYYSVTERERKRISQKLAEQLTP